MEVDVRQDCAGVDWTTVSETLQNVGMAHHEPDVHKRAFEASHTTVFLYDADRLIGFGRAISDGAYQAAVYDCAVHPDFQGKGLGRTIMDAILAQVSRCNVILYASPGKEGFYEKHGFRKMKTGMARFKKSEAMREGGFTE
jgi:ribosomal protein S18 acetylase RimI-like enzyme